MSETVTPEVPEQPSKPSKLARAGRATIAAGIFVIPTAVMVGATAVGYKTSLNQLEAAKIALEAAKLYAQKA